MQEGTDFLIDNGQVYLTSQGALDALTTSGGVATLVTLTTSKVSPLAQSDKLKESKPFINTPSEVQIQSLRDGSIKEVTINEIFKLVFSSDLEAFCLVDTISTTSHKLNLDSSAPLRFLSIDLNEAILSKVS